MVVFNDLDDAEVDRLFRALADATRRDIVSRVLKGEEMSVSALATRYDMSFAAVQKHVAVLEGARLVTKHPRGRERIVRGNPERIAKARELLARLEEIWKARFSRLDTVLREPDTAVTESDPRGLAPDSPLSAPDSPLSEPNTDE